MTWVRRDVGRIMLTKGWRRNFIGLLIWVTCQDFCISHSMSLKIWANPTAYEVDKLGWVRDVRKQFATYWQELCYLLSKNGNKRNTVSKPEEKTICQVFTTGHQHQGLKLHNSQTCLSNKCQKKSIADDFSTCPLLEKWCFTYSSNFWVNHNPDRWALFLRITIHNVFNYPTPFLLVPDKRITYDPSLSYIAPVTGCVHITDHKILPYRLNGAFHRLQGLGKKNNTKILHKGWCAKFSSLQSFSCIL